MFETLKAVVVLGGLGLLGIVMFKYLNGDFSRPKMTLYKVEHYPLSGLYCVLRGRIYLDTRYPTGVICELQGCINEPRFAQKFKTEADAWTFVAKAKEQLDKVKVKTLSDPNP